MEFEILGHPPDAPTLRLDHERFAYAGKFVMSNTGKAVVRDPAESADSGTAAGSGASDDRGGDSLVGAASFSTDHDNTACARIRYVTVREKRRGEGIGPRLLRFTAEALLDRFGTVAIGVNNPMAYNACYRAGFVWPGEKTGMAELLMRYAPGEAETDRYRAGIGVFDRRELPEPHRAVIERNREADPPQPVDPPETGGHR